MQTLRQRKRLSSGEPNLDSMLSGGFLQGSTTLVSGAPGVGKTTLGLQFLHAGVKNGETGLFISFEMFPASLIRDAAQVGWDLDRWQADGMLHLSFTSPEVFLESIRTPDSPLSATIGTLNPTRAVIDSVSHFRRMEQDPVKLRGIYNTIINAFKRDGITSILLDEDARINQPKSGKMPPLPFVVDSVFLMRYVEVDSAIKYALTILKMRGSPHEKTIRAYTIGQQGLHLAEPFENIQGLLSGTTQRVR